MEQRNEFTKSSQSQPAEHSPDKNSCSKTTASSTIFLTSSLRGGLLKCPTRAHAKSVCIPSSLLISSFENVNPGIKPRFFSQNIAAKLPEKKMPSTAAKATSRSPKVEFLSDIHRNAHAAFFAMQGTDSMALKSLSFSSASVMSVSMRSEYVSECTFSLRPSLESLKEYHKRALSYGRCTSGFASSTVDYLKRLIH